MEEKLKRIDAHEEISTFGGKPGGEGLSTSLAKGKNAQRREFQRLYAWVKLCKGWGLVVAHRAAGGDGYPRNRSLAGKGRRGSPSDSCSLADAYMMVESVLESRAPVDRKILAHSYARRHLSDSPGHLRAISESFPELAADGCEHEAVYVILKGCRKRLAHYAIGRLKL